MSTSGERVPCSKRDYLQNDDSIRGQNYALVSFLSPEDILKNKEVFMFSKFIGNFSRKMKLLLDGLAERYPESKDGINVVMQNHAFLFDDSSMQDEFRMFMKSNPELEDEFYRDNDFRTCVRGIKIRGTFDTIDEAKSRSEALKVKDPNFDIFISSVGFWCPWSPNPADISDSEYAETELNTLMKKYEENVATREEFYEQRKQDLKRLATENNTTPKVEVVACDDVVALDETVIAL